MTFSRASLVAPLAVAFLGIGCSEPDRPPACATGHCQSLTFVTSTMEFAKHADPVGEPTIVRGFDLDSMVTVDEPEGCYQPDQVSPDGTPGIDNAAAKLFELIAGITQNAVEGLVQQAINQGSLLLVLRLEGVDDLRNDDHVTVRLFKGTGVPQLGTNGRIAPNQTFEIDPSIPSTVGHGRIVDGVFDGGPFEAVVPIQIFAVSGAMRLHRCRVHGILTEDGRMVDTLVGGGVELVQIYDLATQAEIGPILALLPYVLDPIADLAPNAEEVCEQVSAALTLETEPAYLLGDPFRR